MLIHFRVDGGFATFPGLSRPFCVDVDALPGDEAMALRASVSQSRFFDRPEAPAAPAAVPDGRRYVVTVDDGGRSRTLTFADTGVPPELDALVGLLQARRKDARMR